MIGNAKVVGPDIGYHHEGHEEHEGFTLRALRALRGSQIFGAKLAIGGTKLRVRFNTGYTPSRAPGFD